jgi:tetratricopeptide (TPR) repeat protein
MWLASVRWRPLWSNLRSVWKPGWRPNNRLPAKDFSATNSYNTYLTYLRCGVAYWEMGEYDRALVDLDEAIRLNPEYAGSYYERGLVHLGRGELRRSDSRLHEEARV